MPNDLHHLEEAIRQLSPQQRAAFRAWFVQFDADEWDRQMESDVAEGKLDWLVEEARREREAGRCTEL